MLKQKTPTTGPGSTLSDFVYSKICTLLIEGETIHMISLQTGISDYTVKGIKSRIADQIPDWKKNTKGRMERLITELLDSLSDDLQNNRLCPDRKAIAIGILMDKREKLVSRTDTAMIERLQTEDPINFSTKLEEWLSGLPAARYG
ncbi:hypothetical protein N8703_03685 [Verrucomicrobia bacterium]|nr:hypothetical protein [Verrucomicrobiota bacterium]